MGRQPMVFGEIIALCSSLFWGMGNLLVRRGQTASGESGMMVTTMVNSVLIGCVVLVEGVLGVLHGHGFVASITGGAGLRPAGLAWFVAAGLLTTLMGRSLFFASMKVIGPSRASSIKGTSPVFTALLAVLAVGEAYTLRRGLGTVVALTGLWILNGEMNAMSGRPAAKEAAAAAGGEATTGGGAAGGPPGGEAAGESPAAGVALVSGAAPAQAPAQAPAPAQAQAPAQAPDAAGVLSNTPGRPALPPVEGGSGQNGSDQNGPGQRQGASAPAVRGSSHRSGLLLGLLCAASFGSGAVLRKVGLDVLPSPALGAWISSTLAFLAITASTGAAGRLGEAVRNNRRALGPFLLAGVSTTIAQLMVFVAYSESAVSLAAVLAAMDPVFTVGLSRLVLRRDREHITPRTVLGVLLTVAGAAAVIGS